MPQETLHFFRFIGSPRETSSDAQKMEGAFICAWVDHPDQAIAEQIARDGISERDWDVVEVEEVALLSRYEFVRDPERKGILPRFNSDGFALTFFCWPRADAEFHEG